MKKKKENQAPESTQDVVKLASRVGELESELTQSRMDNAALRAEADKLRKDLAHANKRRLQLKAELAQKKQRIAGLEKENVELADKVRALSSRNWRDFAAAPPPLPSAPVAVAVATNATAPVFTEAPVGSVAPTGVGAEKATAAAEGRFGGQAPVRRGRAGSFDVRMLQEQSPAASRYSTLSQFLV